MEEEKVIEEEKIIEEKHDYYQCSSCGGHLEYNPKKRNMKCPFCGNEETVMHETPEKIEEYDFYQGIKNKNKNWGMKMRVLKCKTCGSQNNIDLSAKSVFCPFCGSPHVVSDEEYKDDIITPETLIPFKIEKEKAESKYKEWISKLWFAPNDIKKYSISDKLQGVYIPFWTYDSDTITNYQARRGDYYYDTYTTYENGKKVTKRVRKIRWTNVSGAYEKYFNDVLVSASKNINQETLKKIDNYNLTKLVSYNPRFLSGFLAERYTVDLIKGWSVAKQEIDYGIDSGIKVKVGGDLCEITYKTTNHKKILYKHILLPLWISSYNYKNKIYHYFVNGETGKVGGKYPISILKVTLLVIAIIILLVLMGLAFSYYGADTSVNTNL